MWGTQGTRQRTPFIYVILDREYRDYLQHVVEHIRQHADGLEVIVCEQQEWRSKRWLGIHADEGSKEIHRDDLALYIHVSTSMRPDISGTKIQSVVGDVRHCILLVVFKSSQPQRFPKTFEIQGIRSGLFIEPPEDDEIDGYIKCFLQIVSDFTTGIPHEDETNSHYWNELEYIAAVLRCEQEEELVLEDLDGACCAPYAAIEEVAEAETRDTPEMDYDDALGMGATTWSVNEEEPRVCSDSENYDVSPGASYVSDGKQDVSLLSENTVLQSDIGDSDGKNEAARRVNPSLALAVVMGVACLAAILYRIRDASNTEVAQAQCSPTLPVEFWMRSLPQCPLSEGTATISLGSIAGQAMAYQYRRALPAPVTLAQRTAGRTMRGVASWWAHCSAGIGAVLWGSSDVVGSIQDCLELL